jgi:hypothetical protein
MRNGRCSSCGSPTVYAKTGGIGFGSSEKIYVYTGMITKPVAMTTFVCTTCGFFESFIADAQKLAEVAKNWPKVPVGG